MTAADLARVLEYIDADAEVIAEFRDSAPRAVGICARDRWPLYIALARAVATGLASELVAYRAAAEAVQALIDSDTATGAEEREAKRARDTAEGYIGAGDAAIVGALLALAPAYTEEDLGHA